MSQPNLALPRKPRQGRRHYDPALMAERKRPRAMIQAGYPALAALARYQALTSWQLAKLLFLGRPSSTGSPRGGEAAKSAANRMCLRRLKDHGYVTVIPAFSHHWSGPMAWLEVNVLTSAGVAQLNHLYLEDELLPSASYDGRALAGLTNADLTHQLAVADVLVVFEAAASLAGWQVIEWGDERALRSWAVSGHWQPRLAAGQALVIPDGYLRLQHADGRDHTFLLEADCGTEKLAAWQQKLGAYATFFAGLDDGHDPFWRAAATTGDHRRAKCDQGRATGKVDESRV